MEHGTDAELMFDWIGGNAYGPPASPQTEQKPSYEEFWANMYQNKYQSTISKARENLRNFYFRAKNVTALSVFGATNKTSENVAWHIRRGDVGIDPILDGKGNRYTSNDQIGIDPILDGKGNR